MASSNRSNPLCPVMPTRGLQTFPPAGILSAPPTTGVFDCRAYRVKSGDSLSAIALMFQITVRHVVSKLGLRVPHYGPLGVY